jgi:hypothetical protein
MPLQLGGWTFNVAGAGVTTLEIQAVDTAGDVTATLGDIPYIGFWDEAAQKLTLSLVSAEDFVTQQVLVGYLFTDSVNLLGVTGSVILTLTGYVENFTSALTILQPSWPVATAKRSVFGWYAQIGVD